MLAARRARAARAVRARLWPEIRFVWWQPLARVVQLRRSSSKDRAVTVRRILAEPKRTTSHGSQYGTTSSSAGPCFRAPCRFIIELECTRDQTFGHRKLASFGSSLASGGYGGHGRDDLVIGTPYERAHHSARTDRATTAVGESFHCRRRAPEDPRCRPCPMLVAPTSEPASPTRLGSRLTRSGLRQPRLQLSEALCRCGSGRL